MGANSEVFLKMSEEDYLKIDSEVRQRFLTSKRIDSDNHDWQENMEDKTFANLYKLKKQVTKDLDERKYQLREQRRANK